MIVNVCCNSQWRHFVWGVDSEKYPVQVMNSSYKVFSFTIWIAGNIRMMSKCVWVSRIVLMMRWFFYTFWERTLRFFKIIFSVYRSPKSGLIWICCHGFQRISWGAILCWSGAIVATTRQNGTHSLLTSAKLLTDYLIVGITRELNKEPLLYYPLYIYMAPSPCYNNIYLALKSMPLSHILLLIHMCFS